MGLIGRAEGFKMHMRAKRQEIYQAMMNDERVRNAFANYGIEPPQDKNQFIDQYNDWPHNFKMELFHIVIGDAYLKQI